MKLIIDNHTELSDKEALGLVLRVIKDGKVSQTRGIKHYCHGTVFHARDGKSEEICVSFILNHAQSGRFLLTQREDTPGNALYETYPQRNSLAEKFKKKESTKC